MFELDPAHHILVCQPSEKLILQDKSGEWKININKFNISWEYEKLGQKLETKKGKAEK